MTTRNQWIDHAARLVYAKLFGGDWDTATHAEREHICEAITHLYDTDILPRLHEAWLEGRESVAVDVLRPVRDDHTRAGSVSPYDMIR